MMKVELQRRNAMHRSTFMFLAFAVGPLGAGLMGWLAATGVVVLPSTRLAFFPIVMTLVVAPVIEELAFRGAVHEFLCTPRRTHKQLLGVTVPNLLTSMLFAACHLPSHSLWLALLTFFPSLLFGKAKEISGGILFSVTMHAWFNLCFVLNFSSVSP